jgi:hypothetical protein
MYTFQLKLFLLVDHYAYNGDGFNEQETIDEMLSLMGTMVGGLSKDDMHKLTLG